jgi:hypothetical protein
MVLISLALSTAVVLAADAPQMPGILANARYVYVTSYDGGQFNTELMPEDRAAISHVEEPTSSWRYSLVRPRMCWRCMKRIAVTRAAGLRRPISGA